MSLAEVVAALGLLGVAAGAALVLLRTSADESGRAVLEGRRAEAAQRVVDQLRAGRLPPDSGAVRIVVGGEPFDVSWNRGEAGTGGGLVVRSGRAGSPSPFVLGAP